jgi:hypothetical protein
MGDKIASGKITEPGKGKLFNTTETLRSHMPTEIYELSQEGCKRL